MTKDIQKLTQNERYDLKRKQVKEEKEAYTNSLMNVLKDKVIMEKDVKDSILMANCDLIAENERLKKQLKDYEEALKEYADEKNWRDRGSPYMTLAVYVNCEPDEIGYEPAKRTLKKWGK